MILRRAEIRDREIVTSFVHAALRGHGIEPHAEGDRDVGELGAHPEKDELVAELDGAVVGIVILEPRDAAEGWVSKLFVSRDCRRRGVGRALLEAAIVRARERGWVALGLRTRTVFREAIALYERAGWVRGEDPPSRGVGEDRVYRLRL